MKAYLHNYRQSPRKVALAASLVRGKGVAEAITMLNFAGKRSSLPVVKLIESAVANAKNSGVSTESLFIKEIRVDKGVTLKRMMPRAQGRGARINKRSSHVLVVLGDKNNSAPAKDVKAVEAPKAKAAKVAKAPKAKVAKAKK
jgi:large subunit ribosomal protein L22